MDFLLLNHPDSSSLSRAEMHSLYRQHLMIDFLRCAYPWAFRLLITIHKLIAGCMFVSLLLVLMKDTS